MPQEQKFTSANFQTEVLESHIPVLVDFWASWCLPCKSMEPLISELSEEYEGKIKIGKLNVDQNPGIASCYNIQGVPTFILFDKGKIIDRCTGAQSKSQLKAMLDKILKD
jgi:thioredoxin 1